MYNTLRNIVKEYLVAIYIRLSKEDDNLGESESIQNQKILLTKYVKEQGYTLVDIYIDDGYTGTNFNRPSFQRMLKDIENGKVNMVITKDLSRLSRDYIGTGEYVEKWFPAHNVRYVALTDNIDTFLDNSNNDIAPFKAILNDMYAKDLSKKIRTALHTMQSEGKWVGGCPPFGYKVDPDDKNHLVIDEVEAPIVKRIFDMFASGVRINKIRDTFNNENVPTFSITRNRNFTRNGNNGNIYGYWCNTTIKKILQNRLYTGDMIQNRRSRLSYKYRKIICNPKENWIIVENTHEAIIDSETFNKVQIAMKERTKPMKSTGVVHNFSGKVFCLECKRYMRKKNSKLHEYLVCSNNRDGYDDCINKSSIRYDVLENIVLDAINKKIEKYYDEVSLSKIETKNKKSRFIDKIKSLENQKLEAIKKVSETRKYLKSLYEDKVNGIITAQQFKELVSDYNSNESIYNDQIKSIDNEIEFYKKKEIATNDNKKIFSKYKTLESLNRVIIDEFIDKIYIGKLNEETNTRDIQIKWNFE